MTTFDTMLPYGGDEDDLIPIAVSYEMRDLGVMGHRNENIQPVIRVVRFNGCRLDSLSDAQIEALEDKARHNELILMSVAQSARWHDSLSPQPAALQ